MAISYFHIFINLFRNSQLSTVYSTCTVRSRNEMTIITTVRYQGNALIDTHTFNGPLSRTTRVSRYQKGKPIWILPKQETVSGSGISWAIIMQVFTSLQTDNHASTPPLSFLQAGCPSCRPTNSVKALKANALTDTFNANKIQCLTLLVYTSTSS